ncbi:MAG: carbamoyltransferase C-terminal domain-containing protein [Cyanobacteria bacterium P01_F01_bin.150]
MSQYYLGVNLGHERSAALVKDGKILVAIEQERLDRQKYSIGFMLQAPGIPSRMQPPNQAIRYCLDSCGITLDDLAAITANMPGYDFAPDIMRNHFPADIADKVNAIPSHHLAHAYSAYWPSGFDQALVLVADATGSTDQAHCTESYSLYLGDGQRLTTLHSETVAAHLAGLSTLGFVYEYVTRKAGFVTTVGNTKISHAEAGKLMGLAPFGGEQINFHRWLKTIENSYSLSISPYDIFLEIAALEKKYDTGEGKPYLRPYLVDLAYKVQDELEKALQHIVQVAMDKTGLKKLCIAGGVGLNSVANYKIFQNLGLEDIFIFPAAGDNGIAAGAALWAYANQGGGKRPKLTQATLGHAYSPSLVDQAVQEFDEAIDAEVLSPAEMLERSAQALAKGHIVARFEGGSEYGPRALGHRSIMVDPTYKRMRDIVNARVKFREAFRPFAPVIPRECVSEVFELEADSPFMLLVAPIKQEVQEQIPAVTHVDGTGRIQTVTNEDNSYFYQLCHRLVQLRQGPPVLLNTSFNVAGQPIVETPAEAIQTFLNTDIDYLAVDNVWISKRHVQVQNYEEHLSKVNPSPIPHGLSPNQPAVTDLMAQLDQALFFGPQENCPWTPEELRALSALGARYKETSVLFPETPFMGSLRTKVTEDIVWVLDPQDRSTLVNLSLQGNLSFKTPQALPGRRISYASPSNSTSNSVSEVDRLEVRDTVQLSTQLQGKGYRQLLQKGTTQATAYSFDEVKLLIAMLSGQEDWRERIRVDLCLTHAELESHIAWAVEQLTQYGLQLPEDGAIAHPSDSSLPPSVAQTLEPFSNEQFSQRQLLAELRSRLHHANYTLDNICDRLNVESLQAIEPTRLHYYDRYLLGQALLDDLIRLFLLRVALPKSRLEDCLGVQVVESLIRLGVIIRRSLAPSVDSNPSVESAEAELWSSRIDLFCVDGLYIATDHRYMLLAEDQMDENPVMYVGADSQGLVYSAPRYPAKQLLDLCCGGGIQGLVASRYAQKVTSVDLNPRAIRFARFNAQLNDIRNIQFRLGSLYEPVGEQRFDTILANPPFVPSPTRELGFRDGGATGEDILAAIIAGSAAHLNPNGHVFIVTDLVDIDTYEAKLAQWWQGGAAHQLVLCTADRDDILFSVPHSHAPFGQSLEEYNTELEQWVDNFHQADLKAVNFGYILIQKSAEASYFCRTVHNPTQAIYPMVQSYFQQQELVRSPLRATAFLTLMDGLRIRVEEGVYGGERKIELLIPNNSYFTTYQINEGLYQLLKTIQRLQPQWQDFATPANRPYLENLIGKGLLILSMEQPRLEHDSGNGFAERSSLEASQKAQEQDIVELRTKTTPTCLSAYLK